ncbi:MAG: hypothetical protein HC800_22110, partial [Phormidesmis sp. RL_2_1]|nr:hypothetical protein [Phormidesmis sp. RL_2_1]
MNSANEAIAEVSLSRSCPDTKSQHTESQCLPTQDVATCCSTSQWLLLKALLIEVGQAQDLDEALKRILQTICQHQHWQYGEAWQLNPKIQCLEKRCVWDDSTRDEISKETPCHIKNYVKPHTEGKVKNNTKAETVSVDPSQFAQIGNDAMRCDQEQENGLFSLGC